MAESATKPVFLDEDGAVFATLLARYLTRTNFLGRAWTPQEAVLYALAVCVDPMDAETVYGD